MKNVTIQDVANAASVSTASVSKALNGKPDISEKRREQILCVADELGYRVNSSIQDLARRGRGGFTRNIAFVMVGYAFADPAYARAVDGVARAATEHRLHLMLDRLRGDERNVFGLPPVLRDGRVDGLLATGDLNAGVIAVLNELDLPYVILGSYAPAITAHAVNVLIDLAHRIDALVDQLVRCGKRRIAYFSETVNDYYEQQSLAAFKMALSIRGLEADESLIYTGTGAFTGATPVLAPVFAQSTLPFDAIVCLDFRSAQEISHLVLAHAGIGVRPDIVMAVGRPFDYYRLPVPSVYLEASLDEVAYEGVNALMDLLTGRNKHVPKQIVLRAKVEEQVEPGVNIGHRQEAVINA